MARNSPPLMAGVAGIARDICGGDQNPLLFEQALLIAQHQVVLARVRAERLAALERLHDITRKPIESRDELATMCQAMPTLERLARYERRAWSGRNRALHNFVAIKSTDNLDPTKD